MGLGTTPQLIFFLRFEEIGSSRKDEILIAWNLLISVFLTERRDFDANKNYGWQMKASLFFFKGKN